VSDSEVAAILLWKMMLNSEIEDRIIVDLGAGTGILGIGALLLGAKHVIFVDVDSKMKTEIEKNIEILNENWEIDVEGRWNFVCKDVKEFQLDEKIDKTEVIVLMNPPFGTRNKHLDKVFLEKAMELTHSIYTMHKTSTKVFIEALCRDNNLDIYWLEDTSFPIKNTMQQHTKKIERIEVSLFNLRKNN